VAHDFNNLLTVIAGYSELILERLPDDEEVVRAVAEIRNAGARGMGITGQLLAFGRKAVIQPVTVDLNVAVAEDEAMLRRLIGEHIELTATYDPALWRVRADRIQIDQVLLNLAVNARDAMPQGGQLALTTRNVTVDAKGVDAIPGLRPGDYVRLSVTDTGCGMDEGTKVRVFEPFFTTKDAGRGTGMGLAVVYGIVQQSGGHINVTSQPNKGSTFDIYLPRCLDEVRDEEREQAAASIPTGRETVILVEDEDSVRGLAREILTRHGYTVLEATDGPDALKLCQRHTGSIDLLVTDVVMPRMSGLRLADRLRALRPQIKTLFISGYLDDVLGEFGASAGDITLLQKPFAASALARKVREVLDRPETPRSSPGS
jgi:CheY-like chemotaxis protein